MRLDQRVTSPDDARPPATSRGPSGRMLAGAVAVAACATLTGCATSSVTPELNRVRAEVSAAERAFAQSMADRDLKKFEEFVSEEAVFFGGSEPLRGRAQVVGGWAQYFASPVAPFSWEPDEVEPLPSGTLAHSSGPVRNPDGRVVARFNSIWRREAPGVWRVIFDKGSPLPSNQAGP